MPTERPSFTRAELEAQRGREVPDLLPAADDPLRLLFVGINPGLWTAAVQTHFAHPGNRFWPALYRGGVLPFPIDPAAGMTAQQRTEVTDLGIGISNLVRRATARADELRTDELREGGQRLTDLVRTRAPRVVAIAGITAYRTAFGVRAAVTGQQPEGLAGADLWVVPNPSGLNAHETLDSLARQYAQVAAAAGVPAG